MKDKKDKQQNPGEELRLKALESLNSLFQVEGQEGVRFILTELFRTKNIKMTSELTAPEINVVDRGYIYEDIFNFHNMPQSSALMKKFYDELLTLRVSKERQSRKEFIDGFRGESNQVFDERKSSQQKF